MVKKSKQQPECSSCKTTTTTKKHFNYARSTFISHLEEEGVGDIVYLSEEQGGEKGKRGENGG